MADVVELETMTKLDLPPEKVLQEALSDKLNEVVVLGFDAHGEFYFASSIADGGHVLWLLELAKRALFEAKE